MNLASLTREKLGEAKFFFDLTRKCYSKNRPETAFFLNAFISAARSATLIMEKEYKAKDGFADWWSDNQEKQTKTFQDFNTLRTISIHHRTIRRSGPVWGAKFNFSEGVESKNGIVTAGFDFIGDKPRARVFVTDEQGNKKEIDGIAGEVTQDFTVTEYHEDKKNEVKIDKFLEAAKKYLVSLEKIVDECETRF